MKTMTILDEINEKKKISIEKRKALKSLEQIREEALALKASGRKANKAKESFYDALLGKDSISIIAEVKKASPSKGVISEEFDYMNIAREYEKSGASAMSVLTEEEYFLGSDDIFRDIVGEATLPLLRKDFVVDEYQVYESFLLGASAILLIMKSLSFDDAARFYGIANELGMDCLFEAHDVEEVEKAVKLGARIIGVNNRDLRDFKVDIRNSEELVKHIPEGTISVSESGIMNVDDMLYLKGLGVNAVLIGESLMRSQSVKDKLGDLNDVKSYV